jgi:uncharacterized membrane protein SpoIIM required for sporulation
LDSKNSIPCNEDVLFQAISYENIVVAFLILPSGIALAIVIFLAEKILLNRF